MAGPSVYADPVNDLLVDPMVWCDVETTGLELDEQVLEVGVMITDADLNPIGEPVSIVLHASDERLDKMTDFVKTMHRASGLYEACRISSGTLPYARDAIMQYLRQWIGPKTAPLCGSNIRFDRWFVHRDLRELDDFCHYRIVDVSSIKEEVRRNLPEVYAGLHKPAGAHRVLSDICDSIAELRYYRAHAFRPRTAVR